MGGRWFKAYNTIQWLDYADNNSACLGEYVYSYLNQYKTLHKSKSSPVTTLKEMPLAKQEEVLKLYGGQANG